MQTLSIETPTHGRVLVRTMSAAAVVVVGFHGYAQSAEDMMVTLQGLPGSDAWTLAAVQALHRFYTRGDSNVVASWMTRQDREQAIVDNIEYADRAIEAVGGPARAGSVYVLGFSQGVAMAYRAGLLGRHRVAGIIAVGGDVPPDVKQVPAERWPRVFVAAGDSDHWYTPDKVAVDEAFLRSHGVTHELLRYPAGHEFTDQVRAAIAAFLTNA